MYEAEFKADNLLTRGRDYYGTDTLNVENNLTETIFLYPVGSIRGIVKDKYDNVVGFAKLKFECAGSGLVNFPESTDKFGSFLLEYAPVGNCKIFARYKVGVGFVNVNVEKGSLNDVEINLNTPIVSSNQKIQ